MSESKQRNIAIDVLKFVAVFMVMNSHMEICYPKYDVLATGGAIGDALFFFASGFTLFLGKHMRFDNWYKRRINRIYPSILATAIVVFVFWGFSENIGDILIGKRYWFIGCILVYYILFYPIKEYNKGKYASHIMVLGGALCIAVYFCFFNNGKSFYSSGSLFRCFAYFLIMLQGAIMGTQMETYRYNHIHVLLLLLSVGLWYALFFIGKNSWLLLISFIPLFGITRYLYLVCCAPIFKSLYNGILTGNVLYIISQLCLEVYLIQKFVFTDALNHMFPLNIPIIMVCVIGVAYLVKVFSNFISQTFRTEPYEWGKMLLYKS